MNLSRKLVISGRLRDMDSRRVHGAAVAAVPAGRIFPWSRPPAAHPSADGAFEVEVDEPGDYRLVCVPTDGETTVHGLLDADRIAAGSRNLVLDCVPISDVAGRVTGPDGTPIDRASVAVFVHDDPDQSVVHARTDAGGAFRVFPRRHGDVTVVATADGFAAVAVRRPASRSSVAIRLAEPEMTATGVVDDREGPARSVRLVLESVSRPDVVVECTTDANGAFVARGLSRGRWRARAGSMDPWAGFVSAARRISCNAGLVDVGTIEAGTTGARLARDGPR